MPNTFAPIIASEVRSCARCGKPTLVCVRICQHSVNGLKGFDSWEYRCQSCGVKLRLHDPRSIRKMRMIAAWMFWAILAPLLLLFISSRRAKNLRDNPVVTDASYPELHFSVVPSNRKCGSCGGSAKLVNTERERVNLIPMGTTYRYTCANCSKTFATQSAGGIAWDLFGGLFLGGGGIFYLNNNAVGQLQRISFSALLIFVGIFLIYSAFMRIKAAIRNPVLK